MAHDTYLSRPRTRVATSVGEVEMPVLYRDASAAFAFFRVEPHRASAVLEGTPLAPVLIAHGVGLAAIAAYDYRNTSIGPYREVGLAIAAVPRSVTAPALPLVHLLRERAHEDVGWYVLDLPVTTATADVGGRELYGLPKFVTRIDVAVEGELRVEVRVPSGAEPMLTMQGHAGRGLPLAAMDLVLYSVREGQLLRTVVETAGRTLTGLGRGLTLRLGAVDHPMARHVATLGLEGAHPILAQVCRRYQAVLNQAEPFHSATARAA